MAFEEKVLYLRLSPEFGGVRFGHFEQRVVRLGSDPSCDIAIAQGFGVAPEHAQVIFDGANNIIVAPADRAADVYLWKPHAPRPELVSTPTAIRPGESFALATPNGPRFIIELDELPAEVKAQREKMGGPRIGGRKLTGKAMTDEVKRQAWTSLLVMGPMQLLQRAYIFVKSGAIFQPRNIILGITMLGGYIIGGASLCSSRKSSKNLVAAQARLDGCEAEKNAMSGAAGDPIKQTFSDLASNVTKSPIIGSALKKDKEFTRIVKERTKSLLADAEAYDWLFRNKSSRTNKFINFRNRLEESDSINGEMARLLVWMVAPPNAKPIDDIEYRRGINSDNQDACVRGPMGLSYRQALSLGLSAQVDAYHRGSSSSIEDNSIRKEKLEAVAAELEVELPEEYNITIMGTDTTNKSFCVYAEGDDDRDRLPTLMPAINAHFDKDDNKTVPLSSTGPGLVNRIARWYSADLFTMQYDPSRRVVNGELDFKSPRVKPIFENEGLRGDWVVEQTAEIFARAIAVPCIGVLDTEKEEDRVAQALGETVPNPIYCLVLNYQLTSE